MSTTSHATKRPHVAVGATRPAAAAVFGPDHDELDVLDYAAFLGEAGLVSYASISVAAGEGQGRVVARVGELLTETGAPAVVIEYPRDPREKQAVDAALSAQPAVLISEVWTTRGSVMLRLSRVTTAGGPTNAAVLQALELVTSPSADAPQKVPGPTSAPAPPAPVKPMGRVRRRLAGTGRRGLLLMTATGLIVALVVLVILGSLVGVSAVVVTLLVLTIAGVAVLGALLHRGLTRISQGQEAQLALQRRTRGLVDRRTAKLSSEYRSPELRNPDLTAVRRYAAEIAAESTRSLVRQQQLHLDTQRQIQAQLNLLQLVGLHGALPPMGGSEVTAGLHLLSIDTLLRHRPTVLVQTGGGSSALLLGVAVAQYDLDTRIVVLEQRPDVVASTRALLARHGVQDRLELRDPTGGLDDVTQVGTVVVTGPFTTPGQARDRLRSTLTDLTDRLTAGCTIVFDGVLDESDWPAEVSSDFSVEVVSTGQRDVTVWTRGGAGSSGR